MIKVHLDLCGRSARIWGAIGREEGCCLFNQWEIQNFDTAAAAQISRELGLTPLTAALLVQRGLRDASQAREFISPDLHNMCDGSSMRGMSAAIQRIRQAIQDQEKIVIYGDYDVDGICSVVILKECIERLGGKVDYYVPNRFLEGYGLNVGALSALYQQGTRLIITVDCGISSVEEVHYAATLGLDIIVTDHHNPPPELPPALAIINPKQDEIPALAYLAGAGVAFKLACVLAEGTITQAELFDWLELVALATVADQVPLLQENRLLVKYGLVYLEKTRRPGLRALIKATGLEGSPVQSWQVGFILAPRLNSAGRMDSARTSIELLTCEEKIRSESLASRLCQINEERKVIEEKIFRQAVSQLESGGDFLADRILVVCGDEWHRGVIGIVASRLAERYGRPAIVISWEGDTGRGSARSIGEVDIFSALNNNKHLLLAFGGHRAAAGLSIGRKQILEFKSALEAHAQFLDLGSKGKKTYRADLEISESDISCELLEEIELLRPFGEGNPAPHFIIRDAGMDCVSRVGKKREHLKFTTSARRISGIIFNRGDLSDTQLQSYGQDLLFELDRNRFAGQNNLQMKVRDLKPAFISTERLNEADSFYRRLQILSRAAKEIESRRPVLLVYPGYRSLSKHKAVVEHFLGKNNVFEIHSHLNPVWLEHTVKHFRQGTNRVYITTLSYLHYYHLRFEMPENLRYIVRLWSTSRAGSFWDGLKRLEVEDWQLAKVAIHPGSDFLERSQGKTVMYANLAASVSYYREKYPLAHVESGLADPQARRKIRLDYLQDGEKLLISDGTHTPGRPYLSQLEKIVLADSPLGHYELAAWTDYLPSAQEMAVEVTFNREKLEYNRNYLRRLYPPVEVIEAVLSAYRGFSGSEAAIPAQQLGVSISRQLGGKYTGMEILASLRIAADLGLCRFEKSGSIMAAKQLRDHDQHLDSEASPYLLEGKAELEMLADWELELNRAMGW